MYSKLQYISQGSTAQEQLQNIHRALDAGCEWIQMRFKNAETKQFIELGEAVKIICEPYKATFILNDDAVAAKNIDADGVHLGLQDMPVAVARNILGESKIIGGTANTINDVISRIQEKCDYIGLGPFRFTTTKAKLSPVLGLEGYRQVMKEVLKLNADIPVYAIGGIMPDDVTRLMETGIYGVAVSGAITNSGSEQNRKDLIQRFNSMLYEISMSKEQIQR